MNHLLSKSVQRDSVWIHAFKQDNKEDIALVLKNEWVLKKWSLLNPGEKSGEKTGEKSGENGAEESEQVKDMMKESGEVKAESEELKEESDLVKEGIEVSNELSKEETTIQ